MWLVWAEKFKMPLSHVQFLGQDSWVLSLSLLQMFILQEFSPLILFHLLGSFFPCGLFSRIAHVPLHRILGISGSPKWKLLCVIKLRHLNSDTITSTLFFCLNGANARPDSVWEITKGHGYRDVPLTGGHFVAIYHGHFKFVFEILPITL